MYSPRNTSAFGRRGSRSQYQFQAASSYDAKQASGLVSKVMGLLSFSFLFATLGAFVGSALLPLTLGGTWILFIVGIIVLFALQALIRKPGINLFLLYLFTFIEGMAIGPLLGLYFYAGLGSIVTEAFLITTVTSLVLGLYAWVAKTDFSHMRDFLFVGLILIIVASLINIIFASGILQLVICVAGIGIFCGLILYDVQKAKYLANTLPNAIGLTVSLFLDVLNLFMFILELLTILQGGGGRRR
ncbi:MAG TPA: Bax inhibitor-1/YccA family protein [Ktedonobacteraceae bacterium]